MDRKGVSRRSFLRLGTAAGLAAAGVPLFSSCGQELRKIKSGRAIVAEEKLKPNSAVVFADAETEDPRVLVRLEAGTSSCTRRSVRITGVRSATKPRNNI